MTEDPTLWVGLCLAAVAVWIAWRRR
jgi:LPXTG-motif cell wall-anchored protein